MKAIDKLKNAKVVWDTFTMLRKLFIILTTLGTLGASGWGIWGESTTEPVVVGTVDELPVIAPEYALKNHAHPQVDHTPIIKQAIDTYDKQHDPQNLKH